MPRQPRKLLLVISSLSGGGAERVLVLLAQGFLARGHEVAVATIFGRDCDFYTLPDGVERIALDLGGETSGLIAKLAGNARRCRALRRAIGGAAPDAVISFMSQTNVATLLASAGLGVPVIVTEHADPRQEPIGRAWRWLRRLTYRGAAKVVSVSRGVDAWFNWLPAERRAVIYNPVDLAALERESPSPDSSDWPHTILGMGRLEIEKGFDLLIDAFATVARDFPDWGLAILGEGSQRGALESRIAASGLGDRVRLPGAVPRPAARLKRADLFVLPSRHEGFGLALVEAMACGLPVVAADCPSGPTEIIHSGEDGLLVPPENADALAQAMAELMADAEKRRCLAQRAREAVQRFDLGRAVDAWERLLEGNQP